MKKSTIYILLFFILACVKLYSQPYGWFAQSSGTANNLTSVYFANANTGLVVGQLGTVVKTTNGGTNWVAQASGVNNHLFGVFFINPTTGWIVGDVGLILKSTNGGSTWAAQNSTTNVQLTSVSFRDANTGYVVGWYGNFLRTTNGGTSWTKYQTAISTNLNCVSFADASMGFAVGQFGKLVRTSNGGVNWTEIQTGTSALLEYVTFLDPLTGLIIGENGVIRKTSNGGVNWINQTSGTSSWLNGMAIQNSNFNVIVGEDGLIRKTSDGGANWYSQTSNTANWLRKTNFLDTNTGWAVGDNGTIIKTTTGGWLLPGTASLTGPNNGQTCFSVTGTLDWSDVFPPICNYQLQIATDQNFTAVVHDVSGINVSQYAIPANALNYNTQYYWRVKARNFVGVSLSWSSVRNFRTINQSVTAPGLLLPANNSIVNITPQLRWDSIPFASTYRCRIATDTGFSNLVMDSSNITGRQINVPVGRLQPNTRYYWKVNSANTCVVSPYSVTWSFTTAITGLSQTGSELPAVFALYNNYPNPFNPTTNISFDIPKESFVKLTIYNLLGEEVLVPVNEKMDAGKYSFLWNASNYSSGLYIYRIEAKSLSQENFVKTIKMVLVK
ncbi:MAG: YCF48-related protein [Ignavibacteria bacterium]